MDEDEGTIRVQMQLIPGRDDLVLSALSGVKERYRAERLRRMLALHLSGASVTADTRQSENVNDKTRSDQQAVSASQVREPKNPEPSRGGLDMAQLDGIDMQMDFLSIGGGKT